MAAAQVLHSVATIDMRVDYLRLAAGAELVAVATAVKVGRTIGVVDVRIKDDNKRLVAIGRAAFVTIVSSRSVCSTRQQVRSLLDIR